MERFIPSSTKFSSGAAVLFLGTVRDHSEGKKVLFLEYEAFEEMAEQMLGGLVREALEKWPLEEIRLVHRLGRVNLGEIAVAIAVESAHRDEAYLASRFIIEGIKHKVPIWKKEYYADGTSEWTGCRNDVSVGAPLHQRC
jgi:molybdopterin synthase catalytic subunit